MTTFALRNAALATFAIAASLLAACSTEPGEISRDSVPFDGIAPNAEIKSLGTEPFWGLDIQPSGESYAARYSTPEMPEGRVFPMTRFAGNNGLGFSGELSGQTVQLAITPGACSDGMSDRIYPFTATLLLGESTLLGCAYTDADLPLDSETL